MSQEGLAEAAGLDRSFISLVERGLQTPNIVILLKVAQVLQVSAADLMARTEAMIHETGKVTKGT
jgi:transcriptional regulator with XRE-family HTH domain